MFGRRVRANLWAVTEGLCRVYTAALCSLLTYELVDDVECVYMFLRGGEKSLLSKEESLVSAASELLTHPISEEKINEQI